MTTILALDTATTACSVALCRNGVTTQRFVSTPREHTRLVLPMVDELLGEAGISLAQVDALAFTAGPGSFTGLRIGFGVVQGLALGADLPVISISTLAVLALVGARKAQLDSGCVLPALDARMGEVYWGLYRYENGTVKALGEDQVASPRRVMEFGLGAFDLGTCDPGTLDLGVGDGWPLLMDAGLAAGRVDAALTPDASGVAELALEEFMRGGAHAIDQVDLVYVRNEVSWKKREKIRRS